MTTTYKRDLARSQKFALDYSSLFTVDRFGLRLCNLVFRSVVSQISMSFFSAERQTVGIASKGASRKENVTQVGGHFFI
jgi:hypothetical protein